MINDETLNNLYEGVIGGKELTTKELNSYGFNSKDLTDLINTNVLERTKRGYYSFLDVNELYYYGRKLISMQRDYNKATLCFEKCHELNPAHNGASFQLFFRKIRKNDYMRAFDYFDSFYNNTQHEYYFNDSNFYLYLLNIITDIPKQHQKFVKFIQYEDIKIDSNDKRYANAYYENRMRSYALNKKIGSAIKELNDFTRKKGKLSLQDVITKELLVQANEKMNNNKKIILSLVKDKKCDELIEFLEKLDQKNCLSQADKIVLQLTRDYKYIKENKNMPEVMKFSTDKLFEAIKFKNYDLALKLFSNDFSRVKLPNEENSIYILLQDINKEKEFLLQDINKEKKEDPKTILTNLTQSLLCQDLDNTFILLKKYLGKIDKEEHELLVTNMIKLDILKKDNSFLKAITTLNNITKEDYTFDVLSYMKEFYSSLAQSNFDFARIYLNIIENSNELSRKGNFKYNLKQVLDTTEKMFNYTNSNKDDKLTIEEKQIKKVVEPIKVIQKTSQKNTNQEEIRKAEIKKFLIQKIDELYRCGMILLKPMNLEKRKIIYDIMGDFSDVALFEIGDDKSKQIVMRFKPYQSEKINASELSKEGNIAYKIGDYNTCIDKYRQILEYGNPESRIYSKIGLAYMKKFNPNRAIDYLTVATYLSNQEKSDYDFTEVIDKLKGKINSEDKKPKVKMQEEEFYNDVEDYFGIECIDEISNLLHSGVSLDESCTRLNLNEHQKQLVTLICAKECYAVENYNLGDKYIKKVEKSNNKQSNISNLIYEIKKNKRFYKNRTTTEENKKLVLIPCKKSTN